MAEIASAAPIQPLVQGLVTIVPGAPPTLVFEGHGILQAVYVGAGHYVLFFDPGLPGLAGAVEPLPIFPLTLPTDPNVRTNIMPLGVGNPPVSGIFGIGFTYIASAIAGVGAIGISIVLTTAAFIPFDPQNGFEINIWKGLGGGPVP